MNFSQQFQNGSLIATVKNTSTGALEETYRICRINGVVLITQELPSDAVNVKPLLGRERLTTMKNGISGKTITWLSGFDPDKDIAYVGTSNEAALAFGINLGVTQISGTTVTTANYTILKSTTINADYIEPLSNKDVLENTAVQSLVIMLAGMQAFINSRGLELKYAEFLTQKLGK